ncbi:hypothetical protein [Microbacterium oxydans]|uniref:hypothetical protein n=1 Tax=Microbacterium oxydans TaxID=82380 RepID=UPI00226B9C1D|nr:hypothetical protein [Microbacterium oxydans]WAA65605.1 hypothetical protein MME74_15425 [Microbacterium oxydans]
MVGSAILAGALLAGPGAAVVVAGLMGVTVTVVWVDGGTVYHVCEEVSDIQTGNEKRTGTTAQAVEAGESRLTLKFASELRACGLATPENTDEIEVALRSIQGGAVDTPLPAPVWADPEDAPISVAEVPAT